MVNSSAAPIDTDTRSATPGPSSDRAEVAAALVPSMQAIADMPRGDVSPAEFLNRDLSWLEFNRRVLHEAEDERTPLLERVKFLGIFTSNLDEFFMKRVWQLKRQAAAGVLIPSPDGLTPAQQLSAIRRIVRDLATRQADVYTRQIRPALTASGIHLLAWDQLADAERADANAFFTRNVFPILTPLAVDPGHPFPFMSNLSESLGVILHHPDHGENLFARIKVPETLPRWIALPAPNPADGQFRFVSLYDMIRHNLGDLFPEMRVVDVMPFRITRNADIELNDDDTDDLRELVTQELRQRRFGTVVRLEHGPDPNPWVLDFLTHELELSDDDVYELSGELDYQELRPLWDLNLPPLRYEPWTPLVPTALLDEEADIFALIRRGNILVHHPYESFTASVERFVKAAAGDPKVLAIKMTLYRTGDDSPFLHTLIQAAEAGKQVVCLVELKARFDEERNIVIARKLEKAGVHVVYGVLGYKTHTKTTLVVRQDSDGIRCYAHIGTGNYHVQTSKLYTDVGLLTSDPGITQDLVELFHYLTGRSLKRTYNKLLVAPVNMRSKFLEFIDAEIEHVRAGGSGYILAKMNSLEDRKVVRALYRASAAGVRIDLIVRGFCCLRPGVPGLSENIRVISVIGRFLEHSRIWHFRHGESDSLGGRFYIGSADWMYRNLMSRVEAVAPIEDRPLRERLWEVLQIMLHDHRQAWDMDPNGHYTQRTPTSSDDTGTHQTLMTLYRQRTAATLVAFASPNP